MDMTLDAVAFFAEHAARHLVHGARADAWSAAGAVFNDACPHAMPMDEYARKTIAQARRAGAAGARRILESLAAYRIVDAVLDGALCDVTEAERAVLVRARAEQRRQAPPRARPLARRPGAGSVVLARADRDPFTIANVRWGSARVEQRWMHEDSLAALVARLAAAPPAAPFILAVAGPARFSPSRLAFSTRGRFAVCHPERTEHVDTERLRLLARCFDARPPERRALVEFRALCRERALAARTARIDDKLLRIARRWGCDANRLHALLLAAIDIELAALCARAGD